jgi:hypothetical protein
MCPLPTSVLDRGLRSTTLMTDVMVIGENWHRNQLFCLDT